MSRKLEDIDKKNIHTVPEDYFEKLPGIIQSRAVESAKVRGSNPVFTRLKLVLPAAMVVLVAVYFAVFNNSSIADASPGDLLAEVETEALVAYLASSDITTEEIIENIDLAAIEFEFETENSLLFEDSDTEALEEFADDYFDISEL